MVVLDNKVNLLDINHGQPCKQIAVVAFSLFRVLSYFLCEV
jgi:hypothetical protein